MSEADIEADKVRDWLAKTGYPLESEVARAFRGVGFDVFQGLHYEADSADASGAREIDVLAVSDELVPGPLTRCTVLFVIECKASSAPWAVFRGRSPASGLGAVRNLPMKALTELNVLAGVKPRQEPRLLRLPEDVGFRLAALKTKDTVPLGDRMHERDQAHATLKQVVAAARGVMRVDPGHLPTIAIPVIVLGHRLFAVSDGADGGADVVQSGWERILWRGDRTAEPIVVDVVPVESLQEYAALAATGAAELLGVLRAAALDARDEEYRRQDPPGLADAAGRRMVAVLDGLSRVRDSVSRLVGRPRRRGPHA
jgi:hypothetical protein